MSKSVPGYLLRDQTAHCLIAIKGDPGIKPTTHTTLLDGKPDASGKPGSFCSLVESICPGKRCILFGNEARKGWDVYDAAGQLLLKAPLLPEAKGERKQLPTEKKKNKKAAQNLPKRHKMPAPKNDELKSRQTSGDHQAHPSQDSKNSPAQEIKEKSEKAPSARQMDLQLTEFAPLAAPPAPAVPHPQPATATDDTLPDTPAPLAADGMAFKFDSAEETRVGNIVIPPQTRSGYGRAWGEIRVCKVPLSRSSKHLILSDHIGRELSSYGKRDWLRVRDKYKDGRTFFKFLWAKIQVQREEKDDNGAILQRGLVLTDNGKEFIEKKWISWTEFCNYFNANGNDDKFPSGGLLRAIHKLWLQSINGGLERKERWTQ